MFKGITFDFKDAFFIGEGDFAVFRLHCQEGLKTQKRISRNPLYGQGAVEKKQITSGNKTAKSFHRGTGVPDFVYKNFAFYALV